jgi:hypothetical protein
MKNRQLIENIGLCLEAGLKESVDYLEFLKSRRFFWNRGLRQEAENALEKLNAG